MCVIFSPVHADVDECAAGIAVCPRFRKCINTFGSYICKCHDGYDLQYISGKYQCIGTVIVVPSQGQNLTQELTLAFEVLIY